MNVVIYARTSTDKQATGLEAQIMACKEYCEKKGWLYEVISDEAVSGARQERPGLNMMQARLSGRCWDAVVVYSFSRLSRSLTHMLDLHKLFTSAGVELVSITEQLDTTTPMGKAMFGIIGVLSEMQRDVHAEATRNGLRAAMKRGTFDPFKRKLPEEKIDEIKRLYKAGITQAELAERYGVIQPTISLYVNDVYQPRVNGQCVRTKKKRAA